MAARNMWGAFIPVGVLAGFIIVVAIFTGQGGSGFTISEGAISDVVRQIRDHTRDRWLAKVDTLEEMVGKVDAVRQARFTDIREGKQGPDYLDKFKTLSAELHAKTEDFDLSDPAVSLWKVFEAAKAHELKLTNYYRDIRGAQNALLLEVPAADAVAWVKVVQPQRITLDRQSLEQDVRSAKDGTLDRFKKQVSNGASEIDAMVQHAEKILEKAIEAGSEEDMGDTIALISDVGFGSTAGETLRPDELFVDQGTSDGGFNATPGFVVHPEGVRNDWMYVNNWYVMGPFENRFRSNLDSSFLPETVVDLDNVTIGKNDEEISWEYWRLKQQRIEPSWAPRGAIYYGWTQVWMEEGGKYWVALGSDDYGKMWLNGEQVWKSDTTPKSYRADEYVAEMEFKQGVNDILFRCENNGGTMGWSVIIGTMSLE